MENTKKLIIEGMERKEKEAVIRFYKNNVSIPIIANSLYVLEGKISTFIKMYQEKR